MLFRSRGAYVHVGAVKGGTEFSFSASPHFVQRAERIKRKTQECSSTFAAYTRRLLVRKCQASTKARLSEPFWSCRAVCVQHTIEPSSQYRTAGSLICVPSCKIANTRSIAEQAIGRCAWVLWVGAAQLSRWAAPMLSCRLSGEL